MRTRTLAITMTLVVVTAFAGASIGTVGAGTATGTLDSSSNSHATEISECQVIDESGHYVLTADLETNSTCLEVRAGDVTIDGDDHTITGTDDSATAVNVRASPDPEKAEPVDNVTLTDVTLRSADAQWEGGDDGTLDNVTVVDAGVDLGSMAGGTVVDSHLNDSDVSAGMGASDVTVRDTTVLDSGINLGSFVRGALVTGVSGENATVHLSETENVTIRDNELEEVYVKGDDQLTIANNSPDDGGRFGVWISSIGAGNVTITGNTITGNTEDASRSTGIRVQSVHNLTVTNNDISGNENGIVVLEITDHEETYEENCERKTRTIDGSVEVHGNSLADNTHGIVSEETTAVNAVNNYWGDENGPSSETSEPLEDPQTGELADGDGTTVSEHPNEPGVSNVRFDPWLDYDPTEDSSDDSAN